MSPHLLVIAQPQSALLTCMPLAPPAGMTTADAQPSMPTSSSATADSADLDAIAGHLAQAHKRSRLIARARVRQRALGTSHNGNKNKDKMEILSESMYLSQKGAGDELVGDDWFELEQDSDDELEGDSVRGKRGSRAAGMVRMSIGRVGRGTAAGAGRTIRRLHRKRPTDAGTTNVDDHADEQRAEITEDEDVGVFPGSTLMPGEEEGRLLYDSPTGSAESLSLSTSTSASTSDTLQQSQSQLPFSNTLPTLSEHESPTMNLAPGGPTSLSASSQLPARPGTRPDVEVPRPQPPNYDPKVVGQVDEPDSDALSEVDTEEQEEEEQDAFFEAPSRTLTLDDTTQSVGGNASSSRRRSSHRHSHQHRPHLHKRTSSSTSANQHSASDLRRARSKVKYRPPGTSASARLARQISRVQSLDPTSAAVRKTKQQQQPLTAAEKLRQREKELDLALEAVAREGEREKEVVCWDVLYEHQRGLVIFGLPQFSSAALTQLDPSAWTDGRLRNSPFSRFDAPLPSPFWHWVDQEWMVDMGGDTDEHGWQYALRFRSRHWRGQPDAWRSFVRRRRWVRARVFVPAPAPPPPPPSSKSTSKSHTRSAQSPTGEQQTAVMTHVDWHALQRADENAHGNHPDDGEGGSHHLTKASKANSNAKPDAPQPTTTAAAAASVGLKAATAVLPLSTRRKDAIYGWEMAPCPQDPFLAFERDVKKAGLKTWRRIRAAEEGENDADHDGGDATDEGRAALLGVWRDAVIEINYRRVTKVIKSCRLDREELALWRWWFGVRDDDSVARERGEQELFERERELQGGSSVGGGGGGRRASTLTFKSVEMGREKADEVRAPNAGGRFDAKGWKDGVDPRPAMEDVWDLVEARLDALLLLFEFQLSRINLLDLVLTLHPVKHAHHRYQSYDRSQPILPGALSPQLANERFRARVDFYNDVERLMKHFRGETHGVEEIGDEDRPVTPKSPRKAANGSRKSTPMSSPSKQKRRSVPS